VPSHPASNLTLLRRTPYGVTRNGAKTCKTKPISPRRARMMEGIVQNEAKLGRTGACGQRQLSCGPWLGWGVKCAEQTQFRPPAEEVGRGRPTHEEPKRANEANLACAPGNGRGLAERRCPAGERLYKTNPISPARGPAPGAGSGVRA
jgi:hypothetical protein